MHWLIYTTIAVLSRAIYGVMTKVMSNKIKTSVFTQSILLPLCGGLITFFLSPILGGIKIQINSSNIALILVVAVSQGLGNLFYFMGMKSLTSGAAQISFSSILIFNTILPIFFLKLQLSFINILGVVLLMIAILSAINGDLEFNTKGVAFMTLSAFFFAIYQLSASVLSTFVTAAEYMLIAYLGASIIILLIKGRLFIRDIINLKNNRKK
jgi:drug/metabolite transporter (DMT)-like permease